MENVIIETISFLSKTYPKIYSTLYLEYLKEYSSNYNVNKNQLRALVFLENNGSTSMTDLCARLNIEKGSLTTMVDDLSNKGYVLRIKDEIDKRKYLIDITNKGSQIALNFTERLTERLKQKLNLLEEEDILNFRKSINVLQDIFNKYDTK